MGLIVLAFGSRPAITQHDATAIASLLDAIATPAGVELADDLRREAAAASRVRRDIRLHYEAQAALLHALTQLRGQLLPDRLLTLRAELVAALALAPDARYAS